MINNLIPDIRKNSKRIIAIRIILLILIIANLSFIWINSSKVSAESDKTSKSIARTVAKKVVKDFDNMPKAKQQNYISKFNTKIRSMAHFIQFVPLGILLCLLMTSIFLSGERLWYLPVWSLLIAVLLSAIFALSDEIHQIFVKGRSFEVKDIATDTLGAFCGSVIYIIVYVFAKSLHKNRNLEIQ